MVQSASSAAAPGKVSSMPPTVAKTSRRRLRFNVGSRKRGPAGSSGTNSWNMETLSLWAQ